MTRTELRAQGQRLIQRWPIFSRIHICRGCPTRDQGDRQGTQIPGNSYPRPCCPSTRNGSPACSRWTRKEGTRSLTVRRVEGTCDAGLVGGSIVANHMGKAGRVERRGESKGEASRKAGLVDIGVWAGRRHAGRVGQRRPQGARTRLESIQVGGEAQAAGAPRTCPPSTSRWKCRSSAAG